MTYIYDQSTANNKGSKKQSWELDFGVTLEDQIWGKVLEHARRITKSTTTTTKNHMKYNTKSLGNQSRN